MRRSVQRFSSARLKKVSADDEQDFVPATDVTPQPDDLIDDEDSGDDEGADLDGPADPALSDDTDGFFPLGLDLSGEHPIAAPMGAIPWQNYTKARRLRGVDDYPARVYQLATGDKTEATEDERAEALARFKASTVSDPQKTSTALRRHAADGKQNAPEPAISSTHGKPASFYDATSDVYEPGEGVSNTHRHPDDMGQDDLRAHLMTQHLLHLDLLTGLVKQIRKDNPGLSVKQALHQVHHDHHDDINHGNVEDGSWVPHKHVPSTAETQATEQAAGDYGQSGSVSPDALTNDAHAALHGSPEHPNFSDAVPTSLAHNPGFHHLVQHHGLDPNNHGLHQVAATPEKADKFVQNWLHNVHGYVPPSPNHSAGGIPSDKGLTNGAGEGHWNLKHWEHHPPTVGGAPGFDGPTTSSPNAPQQPTSNDPSAIADWDHELTHGTPAEPHGFSHHIPESVQHDPDFHHLIQHHHLNQNHPHMEAAAEQGQLGPGWAQMFADVLHHPAADQQGEHYGFGGMTYWDHGKDAQGKSLASPTTPASTSSAPSTPSTPAPSSGAPATSPSQDANQILAAGDGDLLAHPLDMSPAKLAQHLKDYHAYHSVAADTEHHHLNNIAEHGGLHNGDHAPTDSVVPHVHKPQMGLARDTNIGSEGEWLGSATLPQTTSKEDVLAHLAAHHPNVDASDYNASEFHTNGGGLAGWHTYLHSAEGSKNGHDSPDGHTHVVDPEPTQIAVGKHLVDHHGWSQAQVAAMKPHEFKAAHQDLHDTGDDEQIGHSHAHPGGPITPPRTYLPNPVHAHSTHEFTWWHRASRNFSGPPLDATTLRQQTQHRANYDNDWNCHVGTHWASLHEFADDFNSQGRIIAAKIRMKNPKYYDNLNHMAHDAYDRLRAMGEINDGGAYDNNHKSSSYGECCSKTLNDYAHGGAGRTDGKVGLQKFRDSLRADGHDGIIARNHADAPHGAMNAIVFSPHDVEITDPHCASHHGDRRDDDKRKFNPPDGWNRYADYHPSSRYPSAQEAAQAAEREKQRRAGLLGGAHPDPDFSPSGSTHYVPPAAHSPHHDDEDDEDSSAYCDHCDTYGHDSDDDDAHPYCSVCEEYGHDPEDQHPYCDWCDEHTEHTSDEHEDEHGEHPLDFTPQDFCPSCGNYSKEHRDPHVKNCVECGSHLPDVNKMIAHGTPVKALDGAHLTGPAPEPQYSGGHTSGYSNHELIQHLVEDHGSNVHADDRYKENSKGTTFWHHDALEAHHDWLHLSPKTAAEHGFPTFEHTHPHLHDYPQAQDMDSEQLRMHLQTNHAMMKSALGMSHEEMLKEHEAKHATGGVEHDWEDYYTHSHGQSGHAAPVVHPNSAPQTKADVQRHLAVYHGMKVLNSDNVEGEDADGWWKALHEQIHADPKAPGVGHGSAPDHTHTEHGITWTGTPQPNGDGYTDQAQWEAGKRLSGHLIDGHGLAPKAAQGASYAALVKKHLSDHLTNYKASGHDHHAGSGAQVHYLDDIHSHLALDHGEEDPKALSDPHQYHINLHESAHDGSGDPVGHTHHLGADDHQVPASLDAPQPKMSWYGLSNVAEHLQSAHGWTAPPKAVGTELDALHQHWHAHPEYAVEHGHDIDHAHNSSGALVQPHQEFVGPDEAYDLHSHLSNQHYDLGDQMAQINAEHGKYTASPAKMQALHELHQDAHAKGEGLAAFHDHKPNPKLPIVDDPSINDYLAKHLVAQHGWQVSDFADKTNADLIDHHHQVHHSLDPHAPHPGHDHPNDDEYYRLHAHDGKQAWSSIPTSASILHHLTHQHGVTNNQLQDRLNAMPGDHQESDEVWKGKLDQLHGWHSDLHADPGHAPKVAHDHPFGLSHDPESPQRQLVDHLAFHHGYRGRPDALAAHPDLPGLHASLHNSPELHDAPAFGGPLHKHMAHHHGNPEHDIAGGVHQAGNSRQMLPPGASIVKPAWEDMSHQDKRDHLIHHHGAGIADDATEDSLNHSHAWHHQAIAEGGMDPNSLNVPHTHAAPAQAKISALDVSAFFTRQMESAS